ncbi:MAG: NHLP family bacteriocin export ABC transporter peptidase/permease/ATPase subunit [Acidobacteriota bacterium]
MLQFEATECGAASLGIILGYYKKFLPLEELRVLCGVSRDGSRAINVVKAARQLGMTADGAKYELSELAELKPPYIVFWNFNHFLVVEGFGRGKVYLNDPAQGPRTVSLEEFDKGFTGVVIEMSPGPEFRPGGQRPRLWPALRARLRGCEGAMVYVVLTGMLLVVPGVLTPAFKQVFIDEYLVRELVQWVKPMLWIMLATTAVLGATTWLQQYYLIRFQTKLAVTTSSSFLWHILRLPLEFFSQRFAGEIGSRVALNDAVAGMLSGQLATTIVNLMVIFAYASLLLADEWVLTLIGVTMASLNLIALKVVSRKRVDGNRRLIQNRGRLTATTMSGLQLIETIKATAMEDDYFAKFAGQQAMLVNADQALSRWTRLLSHVPILLSSLNGCAILCLGAYDVISGRMSVGTMVAFQALMGLFISPFSDLVDMGSTVQETSGNINRLDDVLHSKLDRYAPDVLVAPRLSSFPRPLLDGRLELRKVTFGYSRLDEPLISEFDLTLTPGKRVALVGRSGSGKSTMANLVCGFFLPWSGEILFDGMSREEIPVEIFRRSVSIVSQDIFLFEGTVMENLTMWDPSIPEKNVVSAAMDACIHDVIVARPGGYYSHVEEAGANFSGGQRQRLELARSLVSSPSLVVLDEATSALDPITEYTIDTNLRRRGCACLLIAHRLSTIRDCNEIIVLSKGKVVERGTHEEMAARKGPYYELISVE